MYKLNFIFFVIILFSCKLNTDFDEIIKTRYSECIDKKSCIINLGNEVGFTWDKMYFFGSTVSLEEINKILGFELNVFEDIGDRIIFLNGNKIVYYKEWFNDPEKQPSGVIFENQIVEISRNNSIFKIEQSVNHKDIFYLKKEIIN